MKTLKFSTTIQAPANKVWATLWDDATYRQWTSVFSEGSYAESDWNEGSKVYFLSPQGGLFSVIEKKVLNKEITFKHLGEVKDGVETVKDWSGSRECYFLEDKDGETELRVELDAVPQFEDYFQSTFPEALKLVKQIAEKK